MSKIQIMQIRVVRADDEYLLGFMVHYLGEEVRRVDVTGLGDPKKVSGDWSVEPIDGEMWKDLT